MAREISIRIFGNPKSFQSIWGSHPSLRRNRIQPTYTDVDETTADYPSLGTLFNTSLGSNELFGVVGDATVTRNEAVSDHFFFAHGICGNPLPGGTELDLSVLTINEADFGPRNIQTLFRLSPGDELLEQSRRLLRPRPDDEENTAAANVNFNVSEHHLAEYGYPVGLSIIVAECTNECTGDVVSPANPVACDASTFDVILTVEEPEGLGTGRETFPVRNRSGSSRLQLRDRGSVAGWSLYLPGGHTV